VCFLKKYFFRFKRNSRVAAVATSSERKRERDSLPIGISPANESDHWSWIHPHNLHTSFPCMPRLWSSSARMVSPSLFPFPLGILLRTKWLIRSRCNMVQALQRAPLEMFKTKSASSSQTPWACASLCCAFFLQNFWGVMELRFEQHMPHMLHMHKHLPPQTGCKTVAASQHQGGEGCRKESQG